VLTEKPARIDNEYLSRFTEFTQFLGRSRVPGKSASLDGPEIAVTAVQTPDELLRSRVDLTDAIDFFLLEVSYKQTFDSTDDVLLRIWR
jgi:hypothetical protein